MRLVERPLFRGALLVALVGVAFGLRAWGYDWDLGHPDEAKTVTPAARLAQGEAPDLTRANYPYGALNVRWNAAALSVQRLFGGPEPDRRDSTDATRFLRLVSAAVSALAVAATYALGASCFGPGTGLLATLLLATTFLPVQLGHYVTPDSLLLLLVTLSLALSARLLSSGRASAAGAAGLWAGTATAAKFTGSLVLVSLATAVLVRRETPGRSLRLLGLGAAGFLLGYALADPGSLLAPLEFAERVVRRQFAAYGGDQLMSLAYQGPEPAVVTNAAYLFGSSPGVLVTTLALGGMVAAFHRAPRRALVLAAPALAFFALYSSFTLRFPRNLVVIFPVLAVFAAFGIAELHGLLLRRTRGAVAGAVAVLLVLAASVPPLYTALLFDQEIRKPSTRRLVDEALAALGPDSLRSTRFYHVPANLARPYREHAQEGVRYLVVSSGIREPLLREPPRHPALSANLREVERECELVRVIRNPLFDGGPLAVAQRPHGLTYWIYRIPAPSTEPRP